MTVFEKTDRFLRNLYETAFYFAVMAVKENFRNYVGLSLIHISEPTVPERSARRSRRS